MVWCVIFGSDDTKKCKGRANGLLCLIIASSSRIYFQIVVQEMGGDNVEPGREILDILYATEEGFAVPEGEEAEDPGF